MTNEWSREHNVQTVKQLLELGADVNARDLDGRTALMGAAHKGRNEIVRMLVDHGADMAVRDVGSRDSIHNLFGKTWQAIDYADGLVRVGVQSSIPHPETADLLRRLMEEAGLPVPPEGRTMIIVEQSLNIAAALSDRAVFIEKGHVRFDGPTSELAERGDIARAVFLGDDRPEPENPL